MNRTGKIFGACFFMFANLVSGLCILALSQNINLHGLVNKSVFIFIVFLLLNLGYANTFKLQAAMREYWGIKKLLYIFPAVLAGVLIALMPILLSLALGQAKRADVNVNSLPAVSGVLLTFVIVGWEELWFRGIVLNYCRRYLSAIHISLLVGFLFMFVHILNPEISLIKKGPALFFAGATLGIMYFYYRSIWVPLGVHMGNNLLSELVKVKTDTDTFLGGNGYFEAIVLALLFGWFVYRYRLRNTFPLTV